MEASHIISAMGEVPSVPAPHDSEAPKGEPLYLSAAAATAAAAPPLWFCSLVYVVFYLF